MSLIEISSLSTCCHGIPRINCENSIKIAILLTLQFSCMVSSLTRPTHERNERVQHQFHDKLNSVIRLQLHRNDENRMQRVLSSLSTSDHSSRDEDENSIDSLNHDMTTRTKSVAMIRAREDYEQITFEPEKSSIQKRDAFITTTESSTTSLSSVDDATTTMYENQQQYLNSNSDRIDSSSSTTTTPSPSIEKYPYAESNYPEVQLVSITTNPPPLGVFSPSQIDYFQHRHDPIPYCYELNGNLRYVSNKFATNRQPQGVWSSVYYYTDDNTIPYYYSYNYKNK